MIYTLVDGVITHWWMAMYIGAQCGETSSAPTLIPICQSGRFDWISLCTVVRAVLLLLHDGGRVSGGCQSSDASEKLDAIYHHTRNQSRCAPLHPAIRETSSAADKIWRNPSDAHGSTHRIGSSSNTSDVTLFTGFLSPIC